MKDTHQFDNPVATAGKPVLPDAGIFPAAGGSAYSARASDVAAVGLDFVPKSFVGGTIDG